MIKVEYPDYESEACAPVKMYLRGEFGGYADDVNAYAASLFFTIDRYASYRKKWKKAYEESIIILADRYTTSNMVHQAVKIKDKTKKRRNDDIWIKVIYMILLVVQHVNSFIIYIVMNVLLVIKIIID